MPSLRRTISSPSVRSSPYPTLSPATNGGITSRGNGHRRSSGSESNSRRVLADIEWWRVVGGQHDSDADQESEERLRDEQHRSHNLVADLLLGYAGFLNIDVGVERPSIPLPSTLPGSPETMNQLAALSIAPQTPPRRHHDRELSSSSLESTPDTVELDLDGLRLGLSGLGLGFPEAVLPPIAVRRRAQVGAEAPFLSLRAHCFSDFISPSDTAAHYADFSVSPLSSHTHLLN